ncbi:hypothetical protein KIH07_16890 [Hydrogenophaga taeniospiralis]|uniref:hypothetical protein n=1 Tax=Hydrogenophaga taeniospiralis TaxID=65656 RepID=UPI001CFB48C6|nr:hypothetical protein [Hydrogenophaga taeniospiralis]MCB4365422.1 hypothetical protein [Hydrogenophaga taeniospiralis]
MVQQGTTLRVDLPADEKQKQYLTDERRESLERLVCDVVRDALDRQPGLTEEQLGTRAVIAARAGMAGFAAVLSSDEWKAPVTDHELAQEIALLAALIERLRKVTANQGAALRVDPISAEEPACDLVRDETARSPELPAGQYIDPALPGIVMLSRREFPLDLSDPETRESLQRLGYALPDLDASGSAPRAQAPAGA